MAQFYRLLHDRSATAGIINIITIIILITIITFTLIMENGYKGLPFFRQSEIISDFTVEFCKEFVSKFTRTNDQMIQAARSGKQNIAEAYLQKSLENRIKLLGVARGSLEELLNDYQDFLRQNKLETWNKNSAEAKSARALVYKNYIDYNDYNSYIRLGAEAAANCMVCLINQTNRLLNQKLRWTEEDFIKNGGFRENLFRKRVEYKNRKNYDG